jgi:hypothetical protein
VLLAQNAEQPELERQGLVAAIPADPSTVPTLRPKLCLPYGDLQALVML